MADSYADHPKSITEIKSDRTDNEADWTPRDVLITCLRDLDAGDIKPEALVVVYFGPEAGTRCVISSPEFIKTTGMLARALYLVQTTIEAE